MMFLTFIATQFVTVLDIYDPSSKKKAWFLMSIAKTVSITTPLVPCMVTALFSLSSMTLRRRKWSSGCMGVLSSVAALSTVRENDKGEFMMYHRNEQKATKNAHLLCQCTGYLPIARR